LCLFVERSVISLDGVVIVVSLMYDREKIERLKRGMEEAGVDVLVLRNPENVLYVTGYWPVTGWSLAVFSINEEAVLIVPESELDYVSDSWVKDVWTYPNEKLDKVMNPYEYLRKALSEIEIPSTARVGLELSFETTAANHVGGEVNYASTPTFEMVRDVWGATIVDVTDLLYKLRMIKTEMEIEKLKIANEIAAIGLEAARNAIKEGVKETEIAAACEAAILISGVGYKGVVKRARGFAFVMSGPNASKAWYPYNISTDRKLRRGDAVLIELNVYADGYWSDLTRTWSVGQPAKELKAVHEALIEAQDAAMNANGDGVKASEVDKAAREVVARHGFEKFFPHRLGHGIGVRMHEPPALHPASKDIMLKGMVHSIEPGIYKKDFAVRIEDDVLVKHKGSEPLSRFPRDLY